MAGGMIQQLAAARAAHCHPGGHLVAGGDIVAESNFTLNPLPALKASDRSGRVVYVSSLSKALSHLVLNVGRRMAIDQPAQGARLVDQVRVGDHKSQPRR
jgi:hypothetical protein